MEKNIRREKNFFFSLGTIIVLHSIKNICYTCQNHQRSFPKKKRNRQLFELTNIWEISLEKGPSRHCWIHCRSNFNRTIFHRIHWCILLVFISTMLIDVRVDVKKRELLLKFFPNEC